MLGLTMKKLTRALVTKNVATWLVIYFDLEF